MTRSWCLFDIKRPVCAFRRKDRSEELTMKSDKDNQEFANWLMDMIKQKKFTLNVCHPDPAIAADGKCHCGRGEKCGGTVKVKGTSGIKQLLKTDPNWKPCKWLLKHIDNVTEKGNETLRKYEQILKTVDIDADKRIKRRNSEAKRIKKKIENRRNDLAESKTQTSSNVKVEK